MTTSRASAMEQSHLHTMEVVLGCRPPDRGLSRRPQLRPLRRVVVPGARLEIAEHLVGHLVELAEELDGLFVLVAMMGGNVLAGPMPQRSPDDRHLFRS